MDSLLQDVRYALRLLAKRPGFTLVATLALALGIGANTAIFSVVNAVLLSPLPYEDPARLVRVFGTSSLDRMPRTGGAFDANTSPNDFSDWRSQARSFDSLTAFTNSSITLTGQDEPLRLRCPVVSADFFSVLGVQPSLGRFFLSEEEQVGKHRVVVLSHNLWQRQFGVEPGVINQPLTLNGQRFTVVGVAPAGFKHPIASSSGEPELWRPLALQLDPGARGGHFLRVIARLRPGVTIEQAQAEMDGLTGELERQYPDTNTGRGVRLSPLHEATVGDSRTALVALFAAVGFVLLIACANVANLLLARSAVRQKEMAIRLALGAGRLRIMRQVLTESTLLAMAGGAAGLLVAMWGTDLLISIGAGQIPRLDEIRIDAGVFAFTASVSLVTGIVFGLAPAIQASSLDLHTSLKEGGRSSGAASRRKSLGSLLVVSEVALSLVLLIGAGLTIKSFWRLTRVDLGFSAESLLTAEISLPQSRYPERSQAAAFNQQLLERLRALPGVRAAGSVNMLPLSGSNSCDSFVISGRPSIPAGEEPCAEIRSSSAGYFQAMEIPLVRGRYFTEEDNKGAPLVVIINAEMARRFFPGEDPIGKRISLTGQTNPVWQEIVGVVGDVKHFGVEQEPQPEIYQPQPQAPSSGMTFVVRADRDASALSPALRSEVRAIDRDLPVYNLTTMKDYVSRSVAQPRFRTLLFGAFAGLALLLAITGIYGVISYSVSARTQEIGIRMALGAEGADIVGMVVGRGLKLTAAGIAAGLSASLALTRLMESLLYEVSPSDPITFAALSLLLMAAALLASYIPARRAARVDPMVALRHD